MSEQTPATASISAGTITPAAPAPVAPQPAEQNVEALPEWAREAIGKANKEAANYRTRVRELEPLANKAQEIEEAQKSEAQRLADRQVAIERERDEARAEGLRYKAAATHNVGSDYFDLLGTGTEDEITQRAQRVGTLVAENAQMKAELEALRAGKPAPTHGRPVEALKPGATAENTKTEDDLAYERLFGVQK